MCRTPKEIVRTIAFKAGYLRGRLELDDEKLELKSCVH